MYRADAGVAHGLADDDDAGKVAIRNCAAEFALVGDLLRAQDLRLSFHLHNALVLNSPYEDRAWRATREVSALGCVLNALGLSRDSVIVVHLGGVYDDAEMAKARFAKRYECMPRFVRERVCVENDDRRFSFLDAYQVHQACGIPLVFDHLHHRVLNPQDVSTREALGLSLATWPQGMTPKIHFSTPRTEVRGLGSSTRIKMPTWTEHADMVNPFEFIDFVRTTADARAFDVMLEAKARDLALLRLREDLRRFAPDLAARFR